MLYLVYKTTNMVNGKHYIGTHRTENRHDGYLGSGTVLKRAIQKYGEINFTKEILFEANTAQEMFDKEKELVVIGPESYNLHPGGFGGFAFVNEHGLNNTGDRSRVAEKIRTARSLWSVEKTEHHNKLSADTMRNAHKRGLIKYGTFTGKYHTDETKSVMSNSQKKVDRAGKNNPSYGKPRSPETKEKIRRSVIEYNKKTAVIV